MIFPWNLNMRPSIVCNKQHYLILNNFEGKQRTKQTSAPVCSAYEEAHIQINRCGSVFPCQIDEEGSVRWLSEDCSRQYLWL
jgi:hypothetical protein